jgi:hypothetical protein
LAFVSACTPKIHPSSPVPHDFPSLPKEVKEYHETEVPTLTSSLTGNFVGPLLFKEKDAPGYVPGFIAVLATSAVSVGLSLVYRFVCIWEIRQRDKTGVAEAFDHAYEDDLTDKTVRKFAFFTPVPIIGKYVPKKMDS